jgi:hypothetical protein
MRMQSGHIPQDPYIGHILLDPMRMQSGHIPQDPYKGHILLDPKISFRINGAQLALEEEERESSDPSDSSSSSTMSDDSVISEESSRRYKARKDPRNYSDSRRHKRTYEEVDFDDNLTNYNYTQGLTPHSMFMSNQVAPILKSLEAKPWAVFVTTWKDYKQRAGPNSLFSCMAPNILDRLRSCFYLRGYGDLDKLGIAKLFHRRKDILDILQVICRGKDRPKRTATVQKEYELPYCCPWDLSGENPYAHWVQRIYNEKEEQNHTYQWTAETMFNGLKKNYNDWKVELEHKFKSANPNWSKIVMMLDAEIYKRMNAIYRWKAKLLGFYSPDRDQEESNHSTSLSSVTLAHIIKSVRKLPAVEGQSEAREDSIRGTAAHKDSKAERRRQSARNASKTESSPKKTYSAEDKAAYALKKQEEREARKSGSGKYGNGSNGGKSYSAEERAAYALKKKSEQATKSKKN